MNGFLAWGREKELAHVLAVEDSGFPPMAGGAEGPRHDVLETKATHGGGGMVRRTLVLSSKTPTGRGNIQVTCLHSNMFL